MTIQKTPARWLNRRQIAAHGVGLWALWATNPANAQSTPAAPPTQGRPTRAVPPELLAFGQAATPWQFAGMGALRFFGFKAYDAILWTGGAVADPFKAQSLFALEIQYNTAIKAEEIVNVSLVEMARLRRLTDAQIKTWTAEMQRTFPSVVSGDRLTGVYLAKSGSRFFLNGRLVMETTDPAFGDAFFAIWLDEGTKRPELRRSLLGAGASANPPVVSN